VNFLDRFSINPQISDFIKILPVGAELLHDDVRTDRHNEANCRISEFCDLAIKIYVLPTQHIYVFCVDLRTNSHYFPIQH